MLSPTRRTPGTVLARTAIGLVAAVLTVQAGCESSDRDTISTQERAERFKPANDAYGTLGYRHIWTGFPTITSDATIKSLDIFDDVLTVQESAGWLSILETSSGLVRWSDQLGNPNTKFLGVGRDDRRILCFTETETSFHDIDTGTLVGKQRMEKVANTKPEMVDDLLVYGTAGGEIFGAVKLAGFRA